MRERIAAWFSNVGKEAKQSADPGLLAALRVLGLLYGRIDRTSPKNVPSTMARPDRRVVSSTSSVPNRRLMISLRNRELTRTPPAPS